MHITCTHTHKPTKQIKISGGKEGVSIDPDLFLLCSLFSASCSLPWQAQWGSSPTTCSLSSESTTPGCGFHTLCSRARSASNGKQEVSVPCLARDNDVVDTLLMARVHSSVSVLNATVPHASKDTGFILCLPIIIKKESLCFRIEVLPKPAWSGRIRKEVCQIRCIFC